MQVTNESRQTVLAEDFLLCETVGSKARGLMFTAKSFVEEHCLIFPFEEPKYQGLHMFFVFYPIDLVFLDDKYRVVEIKRRFLPFTFYNSVRKAKYVLELPAGTIDRSKTAVGDILSW